jgi:hypothetical protein
VQVYSPTLARLPAAQDWTLKYRFVVPPLPVSPTWSYEIGTVYQWGDVDFDGYGSSGPYRLSDYRFNQIVPQLILGNVLDDNDATYTPTWSHLRTWNIQAQYYWLKGSTSKSYALTGRRLGVAPGDNITTSIKYDHTTGTIVAAIADDNVPGAGGISSISIARPFPNDPSLFSSWADFFAKAVAASRTSYVLSTPAVDVETDYLDQTTMCGLLLLRLREISVPGVGSSASSFAVQQLGGFNCPHSVVQFDFVNR